MARIIYLISILDKFGQTSIIFLFISVVALLFGGWVYLDTIDSLEDGEEKLVKRFLKVAGVFFVISIAVTILIPSKEEMYMMALTKDYQVEDVYRMTKEELKGSVDYIIRKIEEIKND